MPKSVDVEKIITDFVAPTSLIPFKNKKSEPANPPRLKKSRLGILEILMVNEIFKIITITNEVIPPINDFSCINLTMGTSFCKITLLILLSRAQNIADPNINKLPIKSSF